tara:strand:+ start:670 stop:1428 length:759 start_codon:yes stop_codon:yes gene_type:complete
MNNLTNIKFHGVLVEQLGRSEWKLAVSSVSEALRAIESKTKKLYRSFLENDKKNIRYRVLINERDVVFEEGKDPNTVEGLSSSEMLMNISNLKTIDIVPVLEGARDIVGILVGVAMVASGIGMAGGFAGLMAGQGGMMAGALVMGGVGLIAAGITNLLTPMPKFGDFREIEQGGSRSYLFNGPENTIREGGPVFVGYGRLLVGSHVIQSASDTIDVNADVVPKNTWGNPSYGLKYNFNPRIPINVRNWDEEE